MWRRPLLVLGVYFVLAIFLTWPTILDPVAAIPGGERTDLWDGLWSFWFAKVRLEQGTIPMRVDGLLNHPLGGSLWVVDPLNSLVMWPLQRWVGLATAWSLLVLVHVTASGAMAWWLAWDIADDEAAAWFGGTAYAASPLLISHIHNGTTEAVGGAYLPAAMLAALWLFRSPGPKTALLLAPVLFITAAAHWYSGVLAFLFWGVLVLVSLASWNEGARLVVTRCLWLAIAGAVALLFIMPMANISVVASSAADSVVEIKNEVALAAVRRTLGAADPVGFFHPGDYRTPDFRQLSQFAEDHIHSTYLGYVTLLGALLSLRRRAGTGLLWASVALSLALAMGPVLVREGNPVLLRPDLPVLLPYALLEHLPGFDSLSLLFRLAQLAVLALAILAGLGWSRLGGKATALAAAAMLSEIRLASPVAHLPGHTNGLLPSVLYTLAGAPEGAVMNFPIAGGRAYLYEQAAHQKPLAGTLNFAANSSALSLWELCLALADEMDPVVRAQLISGEAYRLGIRYLVAHTDPLAQPDSLGNAMQVIRASYRPALERDGVEIYRFY
ncbi:MAG: hypothetical protein FJ090_09235 [Deltaproteobacteria bacterium]|nr:hypothetical protein [Deltaproteobacteria bacterium]